MANLSGRTAKSELLEMEEMAFEIMGIPVVQIQQDASVLDTIDTLMGAPLRLQRYGNM